MPFQRGRFWESTRLAGICICNHRFVILGGSDFRRDYRNAKTFLHVPSLHFLCRLQEEVKFVDTQTTLVGDKDWTAFQKFSKCSQPLGEAIKKLNGATRGGKGM